MLGMVHVEVDKVELNVYSQRSEQSTVSIVSGYLSIFVLLRLEQFVPQVASAPAYIDSEEISLSLAGSCSLKSWNRMKSTAAFKTWDLTGSGHIPDVTVV